MGCMKEWAPLLLFSDLLDWLFDTLSFSRLGILRSTDPSNCILCSRNGKTWYPWNLWQLYIYYL